MLRYFLKSEKMSATYGPQANDGHEHRDIMSLQNLKRRKTRLRHWYFTVFFFSGEVNRLILHFPRLNCVDRARVLMKNCIDCSKITGDTSYGHVSMTARTRNPGFFQYKNGVRSRFFDVPLFPVEYSAPYGNAGKTKPTECDAQRRCEHSKRKNIAVTKRS